MGIFPMLRRDRTTTRTARQALKQARQRVDPGAAEGSALERTVRRHVDAGVPEELARSVRTSPDLISALDINSVARSTERPVREVAAECEWKRAARAKWKWTRTYTTCMFALCARFPAAQEESGPDP